MTATSTEGAGKLRAAVGAKLRHIFLLVGPLDPFNPALVNSITAFIVLAAIGNIEALYEPMPRFVRQMLATA